MKKGGEGGTLTKTGLQFETKVDLQELLRKTLGYSLKDTLDKSGVNVYFKEKHIAIFYRKNDFYRYLNKQDIDWENFISAKLLPDEALLVII